MDLQALLDDLTAEAAPFAAQGRVADYIPALAAVDPARFEFDMENDMDMEVALKGNQQTYHVYGF